MLNYNRDYKWSNATFTFTKQFLCVSNSPSTSLNDRLPMDLYQIHFRTLHRTYRAQDMQCNTSLLTSLAEDYDENFPR